MANNLYQDLPLTDFPQSEDQFTTWLNIIASDGPLILQYQSALQEGNTILANQILSQIPNGTQKIIKAVDLNKYSEAILALERFYNGDIQPYIESKQQSWTNTINQFRYRGTWSSGTTYQVNNLVSYTTSGIALIYIATSTPPRRTVPTNTRYWRPMTIRGPQGKSGVGLSYRQEWNVSTQYQTNDAVTYNGVLWAALKNNQSIQPGTNSSVWKSIITFETASYPIQSTEPQGLVEGDLWFNTQDNPTNYMYLAPLSNPASSDNIVSGKQAYDDQGNLIVGTFQGVDPILNNNSWAVISSVSSLGIGQAYWSVGDAKQITINGTIGTVQYNNYQPWVYILGFNHNAALEGNNLIHFGCFRADQNYTTTNSIALDDEYWNTVTSVPLAYHMNETNTTTGGWEECYMRQTILNSNANSPSSASQNSFLLALPNDLQFVLKRCIKYTNNVGGNNSTESAITATQDWTFLLSEFELYGERTYGNTYEQDYQKQYDYYANGNSKIKYRYSSSENETRWWVRTVPVPGTITFCSAGGTGISALNSASASVGLAPAFCV